MATQMMDKATEAAPTTSQEPTYKDRQGIAMAWVFSALAMFLLLGGLALGAAVIFDVGFGGWLIGMAVMGLVIVAVIVVVNAYILRSAR